MKIENFENEKININLDEIEFNRIKNVEKVVSTPESKVYDLEVETIHNYVTEIGIAHNGGGKRPGSLAIYLEPWHADFMDWLDLKKNQGFEEVRARDLFYAAWIPDLFMQRVEKGEDWTFMCPSECPGLTETWGDEFNSLYTQYEAEGRGRGSMPARDIWKKLTDIQIETGTPYILYKDKINRTSNQSNIGIIKSSNLCFTGDTDVLVSMNEEGTILVTKTIKELSDLSNGKHQFYVPSYNEQLKRTEVKKAIAFTTGVKEYVELTINNRVIKCTPDHKIALSGGENGSILWVEAKEVARVSQLNSMLFIITKGGYERVVNVSYKVTDLGERLYDLTVEDNHNFFIGSIGNNILVHNCAEIVEHTNPDEVSVCFPSGTKVLTSNGYKNIEDCDGEMIYTPFYDDSNLIRESGYNKGILIKNGVKEVFRIKAGSNYEIEATANHPFLVREKINYNTKKSKYAWKKVSDLNIGDELVLGLNEKVNINYQPISDYHTLMGWIIGDGWFLESKGRSGVLGICFNENEGDRLKGVIEKILNPLHDSFDVVKNGNVDTPTVSWSEKNNVYSWSSTKSELIEYLKTEMGFDFNKSSDKKIPIFYYKNREYVNSFLSGLFSADGSVFIDKRKMKYGDINLSSSSIDILKTTKMFLAEMGIMSNYTWSYIDSRDKYQGRLTITGYNNLIKFKKLVGFNFSKVKEDKLNELINLYGENSKSYVKDIIKVTSIESVGAKEVYDISLEKSHNFIANYLVVHNCNLASISLPHFVNGNTFDFKELEKVAYHATLSLNSVIDINMYPVPEAKASDDKNRPIGLGIQGLADVFFKMNLSWDSDEARKLNRDIAETIYWGALNASVDLAERDGAYARFEGSPFSEGKLQFDLWGVNPSERYDWAELKDRLKKHGARNSLLTALMPTASCVLSDTVIKTSNGDKSYQDIMTEQGIDWKSIEMTDEQQWIQFGKPLMVETRFGSKEVSSIFYNGKVPTIKIEMEDGTIFECSHNHKFLCVSDTTRMSVKTLDLTHEWKRADDMTVTDKIVINNCKHCGSLDDFEYDVCCNKSMKIKKITKQEGLKPTWDIHVPGVEEYLMSNGCVSHNTAQILGNFESFEPAQSNAFSRRTSSGEFQMINEYLVRDLIKLGMWNDDMRNKIVKHKGSVQEITELSEHVRNVYKTVWEIGPDILVEYASDRQPFIDQTQSMNLYFANPTTNNMTRILFKGFKSNLKTAVYYTRTKNIVGAVQFSVDNAKKEQEVVVEPVVEEPVEDNNFCSLDNPDACEACSA